MLKLLRFLILVVLVVGTGSFTETFAQAPSSRIALVIGNGAYKSEPSATAANDAGLVAQTLTAAGFDVTGARDLDSDSVRRAFRDFLERASQLGPNGLAFVYLSGLAVQFEGDNYYVPIDATLARDTDVPIQAIRLSDLTRALAGIPMQGRVVVLDAAYKNAFPAGANLAGGLALVDPEPGTLMAFNAAPGTLGPVTKENYGVYGQALSEMLRQGGLPVQEVFDRVRLRANELTKGADVPWSASKLTGSFVFLQSSPNTPPPASPALTYEQTQQRPLREFSPNDAYSAAIARDTFQGYQDFLAAFPSSPYANRVRVLLAARREALSWRKTVSVGTDRAYWTYLRRYPKGPHAFDARRRLQAMSVALAPPPDFAPLDYDVPPPPEAEYRYVDEPVVVFDEPDYGPPPPPPPAYFLPPQPTEDVYRLPPPPTAGPGFLPIPVPLPIPFARAPSGPGRLRPLQGVRGDYAEPQPFVEDPQGGLAPQGGLGQRDGQRPAIAPAVPPGGQRFPLPLPPAGNALQPERVQPLPAGSQPVQQLDRRQPQLEQLRQQNPQIDQQLQQRQQGEQQRLQQLQQQRQQVDQQRLQQLQQQRQQVDQQRQQQLQPQRQQVDQQRQQQLQQQRQPVEQQRQQQLQQQRQQVEQQRQQQLQQQRQQVEQQRQQQLQQQRQQVDQQRQQQLQQQHQQVEQQRQQQLQQQRQQVEQQRQQQLQQQRQQGEQQRQQQLQQQRQQVDQQRQQQLQQQRQQVDQQRQQQLQQQRQQVDQQRQQQQQSRPQIDQQRQQQIQQRLQQVRPDCGRPGQPPCR